jgi:histone H3
MQNQEHSVKSIKKLPRKKVPSRRAPGTVALREIRKYQKTTDLLLPKASFLRVLKDASAKYGQYRWQSSAVGAIQEGAEAHLIHLLEDAQQVAIHGGRQTVMPKDMKLVQRINGGDLKF